MELILQSVENFDGIVAWYQMHHHSGRDHGAGMKEWPRHAHCLACDSELMVYDPDEYEL